MQILTTDFESKMISGRRFSQKNMVKESESAYSDAERYARSNELHAEALVAQGAIFEIRDQFDNAIWMLQQAIANKNLQLPGLAWFFMGSAYREKNHIDTTDNDFQENYLAVKYYLNAANDDRFSKRSWAYNNLANIFFRFRDVDTAMEYYNRSLQTIDETSYIVYYNLGRIYMHRQHWDKAIEHFLISGQTAVDDIEMKAACHREMGTAYIHEFLTGKVASKITALDHWEKALLLYSEFAKLINKKTRSDKAAIVQAKIRIASQACQIDSDDELLLKWWPPEEAGFDGYSTPEEKIFSRIESAGADRYDVYNSRPSSRFSGAGNNPTNPVGSTNVLSILRGWGSATPLLEDLSSECRGGGYFLKWRDYGVVIDPGFDFIRNFNSAGYHMRELDVVVVSHDHSDHNFDLASIDDIFYEMNRRSDKSKDSKKWEYLLFCDQKTGSKSFLTDIKKHRKVFTVSTNDIAIEGKKERTYEGGGFNLPFRFHFFRAKHGDDLPALGLRLECLNLDGSIGSMIGFTCDTEYFEQLSATDNDSLLTHFQNCDIIIPHISQPSLAELINPSYIKLKHLGYRGVAKLIKKANPKLVLVGEFWAGFADMRIDICKGLARICNEHKIIPTSIGLNINPATREIECSTCHNWEDAEMIQHFPNKSDLAPLAYVCTNCRYQT